MMSAKIHRLPPAPPPPSDSPPEHEILKLSEFAKREKVARQTVYKWINKPNGLPPHSLIRDHRQRYFIDYTVFKNSRKVVN